MGQTTIAILYFRIFAESFFFDYSDANIEFFESGELKLTASILCIFQYEDAQTYCSRYAK